MREEQVDSLSLPSAESVQDSIILPDIFLKQKVYRKDEFLFDTVTPQSYYTTGWKATPLKEQYGVGFMSEILVYSILFFGLLLFVRLSGKGLFMSLFSYFFTRKNQEKIYSEGHHPNDVLSILTLILSASAISMFVVYWMSGTFKLETFFVVLGLLFVYHLLILGWISLVGWTFNARSCAKEMRVNIWVYNTVLGLIIAPFVIALFYVQSESMDSFIYIIFAIFFIYLIFRFIRLIKILFDYRVSILYMILYLCALEILPFLVLCKILGRIIQASVN